MDVDSQPVDQSLKVIGMSEAKIVTRDSVESRKESKSKQKWQIVTPGHLISTDRGSMEGHGTYADADGKNVYSSLTGQVQKVSKLIMVKGIRQRFTAEVGDFVIGRIMEVCCYMI